MGDFAEDAMERDFYEAVDSYYEGDDLEQDSCENYKSAAGYLLFGACSSMTHSYKVDYKEQMSEKGFKQCNWNEMHILFYGKKSSKFSFKNVCGTLDYVVRAKKETAKAMLMHIVESGNTLRDFWVPKSLLYMKEEDKETVYVPDFFKPKMIEKTQFEEPFILENKIQIVKDYAPWGDDILRRCVHSLREFFKTHEDIESEAVQMEGDDYKAIIIRDVEHTCADIVFYLKRKDKNGIWNLELKEFIG